jgi:amidase
MIAIRRLLLLVLALCACTPAPEPTATRPAATAPAALDLEEATAAELSRRMTAGELTARQIVEWYLARIAALDDAGPRLNAVIELNPDALAIADALDAERAAGTSRGLLHGIPILIKDNIDTGDRMRTSAGSLALAEHIAERDAYVVAQLRRAGVVILGKTNLSEWANFRSEHSTSGWSSRGGQTRNPYALDRNPCGSSSGTGAAISANLATIGVGTETDGSIICPSSANGLVGIKPTLGLVSRSGIIPIAASQDTAGPMTRTVADAALLLAAMRGVDPADAATAASAARANVDYLDAVANGEIEGKRIGVLRQFFGFHPEVDRVMEQAIATLRSAGAEIVDPVELPHRSSYGRDEFTVLLYEFKRDLENYLAIHAASQPHRTLEDLIADNRAEAAQAMPWFGQDIFERAAREGPATEAAYREALARAKRLAGPEGIDAALAAHDLDALLAPSGGPAWTIDHVNGDHFLGGSSQAAAVAGYPNVTVPAGVVHGLPVGISFIGTAWSEATLIGIAAAYERARGPRPRPSFAASIAAP